jgi:solute:Na+ symporter, SSS family
MLTAKDFRRSRRSLVTAALLDVPIALTFTMIGVLLIAFYDQHPALRPGKPNDVFGAYILGVMPVGLRGLVLAGVFATAMGSLSAALNALATSLTNDWYVPYVAPGRPPRHYVQAARAFTALFAALMIAIAAAFAYLNVREPTLTILPIALGVAGYILGPMLGVFLVGMLTRTRGSDPGNVIAVSAGLVTVVLASGRYLDLLDLFGVHLARPDWLPRVEFTWYALIGATATFCTGLLFRTPPAVVEAAAARARQGEAMSEIG